MEELESLVADERIKFQAIADRLAEQKIEAERKTRQLQDSWDVKFYRLPDVEDNVHNHGFPGLFSPIDYFRIHPFKLSIIKVRFQSFSSCKVYSTLGKYGHRGAWTKLQLKVTFVW